MEAKDCGILVLLGAAMIGACRGDAPTAPKVLSLSPYCPNCFWDGFPPSADWFQHLTATAGTTMTLSMVVSDQSGQPVAAVVMRWRVVGGCGSISSPSSVSDTAGLLQVGWTVDTVITLDSLRGYLPSGDSILAITATQHSSVAFVVKVSGDSQIVAAGTAPKPLVLEVTDRYGNPVPGVRVAWTVGGLGSVASLTSTTGADGITSNALNPPTTAGVYAVIATFGSVAAVVFRVDVR